MKKAFTMLAGACCLGILNASAQHSTAGNRVGILSAGATKMCMVLHLSDSAGTMHGVMDSPDQGVKGIKVPIVHYTEIAC